MIPQELESPPPMWETSRESLLLASGCPMPGFGDTCGCVAVTRSLWLSLGLVFFKEMDKNVGTA